jgi:hypothetical protein
MPNAIAYLALFSWPVVVVVLFWKLSLPRALVASILGGYLFLPDGVNIDLPILPPFDKSLMPSLTAAIMCFFMRPKPEPIRRATAGVARALPPERAPSRLPTAEAFPPDLPQTNRGRTFFRILFAVLFFVPILTVWQNSDLVPAGPRFIQGLRPYDVGSLMLELAVTFLPFWLAQRYLAQPREQVMLLRAFALSGLGYSLLCLFEVRMSPQLNYTLYGFYPSDFVQQMRAGGFRPMVFLHHGLWVGIYLAMAVLAATALFWWNKRNGKEGTTTFGWALAAIWLLMVLFLSKAVGAFALTLVFLPILILAGVQGQLLFAMIVAGITLFYPLLRGAGWIPVDTVYAVSQSFSQERADSLKYRLDNEDILLARASEKPLSGWGSWGRNHLYDKYTGRQTTVTDGAWIIVIGAFGWVGYIAHFGLLTTPVLLLGAARRKLGLTVETSGLAMVLAINLMDLVPNATLTPLTYLIAGALCGRYGLGQQTTRAPADVVARTTKPPRGAWPVAVGTRRAQGPVAQAASAAAEAANVPVRPASDSRKIRQPRRRPE